jgi:hypothetical protein
MPKPPRNLTPADLFRRPWAWSPVSRQVALTLIGRVPVVVSTDRHAEWFRGDSPYFRGVGGYPLSAVRYHRYTGVRARKTGGTTAATRAEAPPPAEAAPEAAPARELTWIEIELVDKNARPVAGERYAIELPDGTRRTGQLDANGRARLEGLDPGVCKVSFPALHATDWEPA